MSVVAGTPSSARTRESVSSPCCMPSPRAEEMLVRLALSKLALKMYASPSRRQASRTTVPICIARSKDSSEHGPAMIASGRPGPISTLPARQTRWAVGGAIARW
jgi:hypothetical protein